MLLFIGLLVKELKKMNFKKPEEDLSTLENDYREVNVKSSDIEEEGEEDDQ